MSRLFTYCNPLSVEEVPSGRCLDTAIRRRNPRDFPDYRSISDPSVIYWEGKWILYPSYGIAWISEDFVQWKHVDVGIPELSYSPAVVEWRNKWYLSGHMRPDVYTADSPLGAFVKCGDITDVHGNIMRTPDSCYLADGEHLYMFWCDYTGADTDEDVEGITRTLGVELDPECPWKMISEPVEINRFDPSVTWQRIGEHNENERMGWIEGQWAIKLGSRYYIMYSGSGTEFGSYANAVIYSDEGALSGYKMQKNHNPLTEKRTGLCRGAGHGCLVKGPKNTLWVFYTYSLAYYHMYERRIGMDPVGIDKNGELFCPETTETPQLAPGVLDRPEEGNGAGLLPLTVMRRATASNSAPGRSPIYAVDGSMLTWWQPEDNDVERLLTVPLGDATGYNVSALRIIWRDVGMETLDGITPGPFRYRVEYAVDGAHCKWLTLIDKTENKTDLCVDYEQFDAVKAYAVRLRITGTPKGITAGVIDFTAFGKCAHEK